jgi:hypothetical protein
MALVLYVLARLAFFPCMVDVYVGIDYRGTKPIIDHYDCDPFHDDAFETMRDFTVMFDGKHWVELGDNQHFTLTRVNANGPRSPGETTNPEPCGGCNS